jgi:tRNA (cmo5U34)-methyltransferase
MTPRDFSFADHAGDFDEHIAASIPLYAGLRAQVVALSRRFVQEATTVVDVGCSTGTLLRRIRDHNLNARPSAHYVGIDLEPAFASSWEELSAPDLEFHCCDAREFEFDRVSLALSLFTVQFVPPPDKLGLLRRVRNGLVDGGALIVAEKTYAESGRLEDAIGGAFRSAKRAAFSDQQVLDKEEQLQGRMTLWTERELRDALREVEFREAERFWGSYQFLALVAVR